MNLVKLVVMCIILFSFNIAFADGYKKHYDKNYNLTGYSKIEAGKEIHYDTSYRRTGFTIYENGQAIKYNDSYEKVGSIDQYGIIYDKDYNRIGRQKGNVIYDNEFNKVEIKEE